MTQETLHIGFLGGGQRTEKTLRAFLARPDIEIGYFLIQEEYTNEPPVAETLIGLSEAHDIPYDVHPSAKPVPNEFIERFRELEADAILRGGNWRSILPPRTWETTEWGCIGLHGSRLPEYRGWAGINWYIINGEAEYGLRMFRFNENIDDGELVLRTTDHTLMEASIDLKDDRTISQVLQDVDDVHVGLLLELVDLLKAGQISFVEQDDRLATWTCHRGPEDGEIDWTSPTEDILNLIRALGQPYPGAFSFFRNKRFTIWRASKPEDMKKYVGRIPGKIVDRHSSGDVDVLTGDGILRIEEITVKDKNAPPADFLTSVRETLGYQPRRAIEELQKTIEELKEKFYGE